MPDTEQQEQQRAEQSYAGPERRSQSQFDSGFWSQVGSQNTEFTANVLNAYFDGLDQSVRGARRLAETQITSMILGQTREQIVRDVRAQVIHELRSDPSLIKELTQQ